MKRTFIKTRGFTLIETLVAISILVLSVTGAFAAAQNGVSSSMYSRDQIIAFYLAQEGLEQIRNLRDHNGIAGLPWLRGIAESGDPCELGKYCRVDALNSITPLTQCGVSPNLCPKLKINTNGFYSYDSGNDTQFTRELLLTSVNGNEVSVVVRVKWSKGIVNNEFKIVDNILNWQ